MQNQVFVVRNQLHMWPIFYCDLLGGWGVGMKTTGDHMFKICNMNVFKESPLRFKFNLSSEKTCVYREDIKIKIKTHNAFQVTRCKIFEIFGGVGMCRVCSGKQFLDEGMVKICRI